MTYSTREAFETYMTFLALQRHFNTTSYDYFKYNGKANATVASFERRKDKFFFYKLSKRPNPRDYILANLLVDEKKWIGELISPAGEDIYNKWLKKIQSLGYHFQQELNHFDDDFDSNLKVVSGQHPSLLNLFLQEKVSIETLIIIDSLCNCFRVWDKKLNFKGMWTPIQQKCIKYTPFLHYDRSKMKKIVLDHFE